MISLGKLHYLSLHTQSTIILFKKLPTKILHTCTCKHLLSSIQGKHLITVLYHMRHLFYQIWVIPKIFSHSFKRLKLGVTSLGSGWVIGSSFSGVFASSVGSGSFGFSGGGGMLAPKLQWDNLNERNKRCFN